MKTARYVHTTTTVTAPMSRFAWEREVRSSTLTREAKLLALILGTYMNSETGVIPDTFAPGTELLREMLGYADVSGVKRVRRLLIDSGYVTATVSKATGRLTYAASRPVTEKELKAQKKARKAAKKKAQQAAQATEVEAGGVTSDPGWGQQNPLTRVTSDPQCVPSSGTTKGGGGSQAKVNYNPASTKAALAALGSRLGDGTDQTARWFAEGLTELGSASRVAKLLAEHWDAGRGTEMLDALMQPTPNGTTPYIGGKQATAAKVLAKRLFVFNDEVRNPNLTGNSLAQGLATSLSAGIADVRAVA